MKNRFFALLLTLSMLLCLLSGCGSSTATTTSSDAAAETTEAAATDAAETTAAESAAASQTPAVTYPLVDDGSVTLTYWMQWPPFLQGSYDPNDNPFFAAMEERTGIKLDIQVCSTETVSDTFNLMVASDSFYDIMQAACTNYPGGGTKAVEDEVVLDLLPYIEQYMPNYNALMQDDAVRKNVVNDEGLVPELMGIYSDYYYTDQGLWVRGDWLDKLNLEKPETLDEFLDMLRTFKSDEGATEPFTLLSEGTSAALGATFGANPGGWFVDNGTVTYSDITENNRDYLRQIKAMYDEGLISRDFTSYSESQTKPPEDVVLDGLTGCFNEDVSSVPSYTNAVSGMVLTALQAPVQTAGEKLDNGPIPTMVSGQYRLSIAASCKYPELACEYIDYMFSDDGIILGNYGVEGTTFDYVNGTPTFKDEILNGDMGFQIALLTQICPGFLRVVDWDVTRLSYNDEQKAAVDTWNSVYESTDRTYPADFVSFTTDESETVAKYSDDISTYCEECRLKFITGTMDLDTDWDSFVTAVQNMGLSEMQAVYQASYDRYESR